MKVFIDLDGVLVNFHQGWLNLSENPVNIDKYINAGTYNLPDPERWDHVNEEFWANLDWMPDGREILKIVEERFDKEDICIVTQTPFNRIHIGLLGKVQWIKNNIPDYIDNFMIGPGRRFCAGRSRILIDDSDKNVKDFTDGGGATILVPRHWNSNHELKYMALQYVRIALDLYSGQY